MSRQLWSLDDLSIFELPRQHDSLGDLTPMEYLMTKKPVENSNDAWTQFEDTYTRCCVKAKILPYLQPHILSVEPRKLISVPFDYATTLDLYPALVRPRQDLQVLSCDCAGIA
jgi:hypothetical protein